MTHNEWFEKRVGGNSVNAAARKSGIVQTTLDGQLKRGSLPAESVIKISRAYGYSPVQGLVDTGYLKAEEARGGVTVTNLEELSDFELLDVLIGRVDGDGVLPDSIWNKPLDSGTISEIHEKATGLRAVRDENMSEPPARFNPEALGMASQKDYSGEETEQ